MSGPLIINPMSPRFRFAGFAISDATAVNSDGRTVRILFVKYRDDQTLRVDSIPLTIPAEDVDPVIRFLGKAEAVTSHAEIERIQDVITKMESGRMADPGLNGKIIHA
jgi:hypothetical protein